VGRIRLGLAQRKGARQWIAVPPLPTVTPTAIPPTPNPALLLGATLPPRPTPIPPESITRLDGKRALIVIYRNFEETEYGIPRAFLEELGVTVTVASLTSELVVGYQGKTVQPDVTLSTVRGDDYDVVIFPGGEVDTDDPEAHRVVREAIAAGRLVAAICAGPLSLAKAGVLEGKRATAAHLYTLPELGAIYTGNTVERDGLLITAKSPGDSRRFVEAIAAALGE
jgi:protease I